MKYHTSIYLHIVFGTKGKLALLDVNLIKELSVFFRQRLKKNKCGLIVCNGHDDHIHLLVRMHPTVSVSDVMSDIKGSSSRFVNLTYLPEVPFQWQRGYFARSISEESIDKIAAYINNQQRHHRSP